MVVANESLERFLLLCKQTYIIVILTIYPQSVLAVNIILTFEPSSTDGAGMVCKDKLQESNIVISSRFLSCKYSRLS